MAIGDPRDIYGPWYIKPELDWKHYMATGEVRACNKEDFESAQRILDAQMRNIKFSKK